MYLFSKRKDGGKDSPVDAYFLIEIKWLFSIAILKFNRGGREAFHTHAFNALTWFVSGNLIEEDVSGSTYKYKRSWLPKLTKRTKNHRVKAIEDSWCITLRGTWLDYWTEHRPVRAKQGVRRFKVSILTKGRNVIGETYDNIPSKN